MRPVYAVASHAVSALGHRTEDHWNAVLRQQTGIRRYEDESLSPQPFFASRIDPAVWQLIHSGSRPRQALSPFEQMCLFSARSAAGQLEVPLPPGRTAFILSTTKGNIEWLGQSPDERIALHTSARMLAEELGIPVPARVVSHACVSGVVAMLYGMRLIQSGQFDHVIVTGGDRFSRFVLSGFQSFQAIAPEPCRPFDAARKGINLGEAAATIILSANPGDGPLARLCGASASNDANHISGPSRTGEELGLAIKGALREAGLGPRQVGLISAHGTATLYNDEMEAKAFSITDVLQAPVHSFKGYVGHTLGAAGVLESVVLIEALRQQMSIASPGFEDLGVPAALNVARATAPHTFRYALKTASGFGGCNAAAVWGAV